ncbi:MAG: hypothetical protein K0S39_4953 [Paenibacillus sp.]|jgi:uncharacterized pyridoxamine 5'-phosphate oxidase family protein|nr:hypothetical protein [Paenibacillus sp.]
MQREFSNISQRIFGSVVVSTVDELGLPVTCAVDIMDYDDHGLYFLTATRRCYRQCSKSSNVRMLLSVSWVVLTMRFIHFQV